MGTEASHGSEPALSGLRGIDRGLRARVGCGGTRYSSEQENKNGRDREDVHLWRAPVMGKGEAKVKM